MAWNPMLDNDSLVDWAEIDSAVGEDVILLLGNGASVAVWSAFAYRSLFDAAQRVEHPIDGDDIALFSVFKTTDFEAILARLLTARKVGDTLGLETAQLRERYRSIQRALREAVGAAHLTHDLVTPEILSRLRLAYRRYRSIYTTNYDLLLYWALVSEELTSEEFVDYFWGEGVTFDRFSTEVRYPSATAVLYLHGAIHLRRNVSGRIRKETSSIAGDLLNAFSSPFSGDETPLFVTEGTSDEKLRRIRSSDYLAFALDRLIFDDSP